MAINFPDSPSNGDTTTLAGKTYTYDSSKSKWSPSGAVTLSSLSVGAEATASGDGGIAYNGAGVFTFTPAVDGGSSVTAYNNYSDLPSSGNTDGDMGFVKDVIGSGATKALYVWDGSEWDRVWSGGQEGGPTFTTSPSGSYSLTGGANTDVTVVASDPDGFPIEYSVVTNPTNQAQATITQPSTGLFRFAATSNSSNAGSFTAKFVADDGVQKTTTSSSLALAFGAAGTGGTESTYTSGGINYKIHTFTSSANFVVTQGGAADYLIVAGGGGAGFGYSSMGAGGGGAGGFRTTFGTAAGGGSLDAQPTLATGTYAIVVGSGGGAGTSQSGTSTQGGNSSFNSIVAIGGGGGAHWAGHNITRAGTTGGSGGGKSYNNSGFNAGTANQGFAGGQIAGSGDNGGGGGGSGSVGQNGQSTSGGNGGNGTASLITGSSVFYAAGGGGGTSQYAGSGTSQGGSGIGGNGGFNTASPTSGATNSGSGGGGRAAGSGKPGGSGIVIIRYVV